MQIPSKGLQDVSNIAHLPTTDNDSFQVEGDQPPLIPPGVYDVTFSCYHTARMFGRAPKIVLTFKIVSFGDAFGTVLRRYYNVKAINGKPRRSGGFSIGRQGDFLREYVSLFPPGPRRLDRLSMSAYSDKIIEAKVKTVTRGGAHHRIPRPLQYSVIEQLVRVKGL